MASEAELLQSSLAGSKEAFGTIVEQYQSLICAITYSGTGDFAKSEELAQETFLRAWKELRQLKDLGRFRAWLCTIARNLARKSIKRGLRDVIGDAQALERFGPVESAEPGPIDAAISKEHEAIVWSALQEIPEQFREPMTFFYREQQSVREVAAALGLSEEVTRQRLSRGRKMLKENVAALVEETLGRTRPGKVFMVAVIAALPALTAQTASAAIAGVAAKGAPAAKAAFFSGLSGAVLGPVIGVLGGLFGGVFGSWMSIKHTKSPREKQFVVRCCVIAGGESILLLLTIGLFLVLALKGLVAKKVYWAVFAFVMTSHFILLFPTIIWANRRQRQIQKEDGTYVEPTYHPAKMSKANVYGAFGGSIFGASCWIIPMSFIARDWLVAVVVVIVASLIFIVSTRSCIRDGRKYWRILIWDMITLCALNLIVVNLRWNSWMEIFRKSAQYDPRNDFPLWAVNLIIGAIFGLLLALFAVLASRRRKMRERRRQAKAE